MTPPSAKQPKKKTLAYTASIGYDRRLYKQDIAGSVAHARMLAKKDIISYKEAELIVMGLGSIRQEIEEGTFPFREELEDIHMNIEARLAENIGDLAGKLHTARSRNDQIALDMRLFLKEAIAETVTKIKELQRALVQMAEAHKEVIMPGYTHLQRAQPVLFAHHLLAYFEMLQRDIQRLGDCLKRTDVLPLGSGALAGVPYPVDREFLAKELGFSQVSRNSMDAVSDRDFVVDYQSTAAVAMMHLSRLSEELVLWSSQEFGFVELDESYTTGSSIMPQKRNPDVAELARGKTGRVYGHLMAILTALKALPLAYNRDLQEDKEGLFDTVDTLHSTLEAMAGVIKTMKVNPQRMGKAIEDGYLLATDLADYLVGKGMPFRKAHGVVEELVKHAIKKGKKLNELALDDYLRLSSLFGKDVYSITGESSVKARKVVGGTAPQRVAKALEEARRTLEAKNAG